MIGIKQAMESGTETTGIDNIELNKGKPIRLFFTSDPFVAERCFIRLEIDKAGIEYLQKLADIIHRESEEKDANTI